MLTSIARLTPMLAAGLLIVACSDDGDKPPVDTGAPDQPVIDQGVGEGALPPDAGADQQAPDAVQPDTTSPNADWTEVAAAPDMLYGVWGLSASQVYAVGKGGVIMTWDGTKWGAMTNPDKNDLYDVWGTSSKIFAVGDGVDLFWDGTTWNIGGSSYSSYPFRGLWGGSTYLFAVAGSDDVYYRSLSSTSSWSYAYSATGETTNGIWGVSETELYAVGDNGTIYTCTSSCSSYSANWTAMTVPAGATSHLQAIWGTSGSDIFAAGFDGTILHYDGTSWKKMTTGTSTYFHDIWGSGPNDVWAVGNPVFKPDESIFHYDGTKWTKSSTPKPSTVLYGVWGSGSGDVWAVGKTSILRYKQ